jgi:hypothetical protein
MEAKTSETKSTVTLDFSDNPDLRDMLSRKDTGDDIEFTVKAVLMEKDENSAKLSLSEVHTTEMDENGEEDEKEAKPSEREPIMMRVMKKRAKMKMGDMDDTPSKVEAEPDGRPEYA